MKILITPEKTLKEIQNEFAHHYPLLKIEFFKKPHQIGMPSAKRDLLNTATTIGKLTKAKGEVRITGKMKISELEQELQKDYGLFVQVFRKGGDTWIETSKTDDTTLEQQQVSAKEAQTKFTLTSYNITHERD